MTAVSIPLFEQTSGGGVVQAEPQRLVNFYPTAGNSKSGTVWRNTPGWTVSLDLGKKTVRASIVFQSKMYAVLDNGLYEVDLGSTYHHRGALRTNSSNVSIAEDGFNIVITDGDRMYRYDGDFFVPVSIPFPNPEGVIFHDGYFIAYEGGTGKFYISEKFDASTWNPLDFATAEDKPDNITGLASDRSLKIFGEYTTQDYFTSGSASFPIQPNPQGRILYGKIGDTWAGLDNTSYWLSNSKDGGVRVVRANGFIPQPISTPAIEHEISRFTTINDAKAHSMMWRGHEWYVLNFPTEKRTFVFDTRGAWFEWGNYSASTDSFVGMPISSMLYFEGRSLFFNTDGTLCEFSDEVFSHGDDEMISEAISGVISADRHRLFINRIELDMSVGLGPHFTDSLVMMCVSKDGGKTYNSWKNRSLGTEADYQHRVRWYRQGSGYDMVVKVRISDPIRREFMQAILDVDVDIPLLDRRNDRAGI